MLRTALCTFLVASIAAVPAIGQSTYYTPPAGTTGMGVGASGWGVPSAAAWAFHHYPPMRARADQVRVGYKVYSTYGPLIGHVAYADTQVAVVTSDHWALRVPVQAFAIQQHGLLLDVSPSRFDKLAAVGGARRD